MHNEIDVSAESRSPTELMTTLITNSPKKAAEVIRLGGLVAFPTETVYGLGADVFNEAAIAKIFEAKMRPADNPLIAHVANEGQIVELVTEVTESAKKFIDTFFPGPLTLVLQKAQAVPHIATAGLDSIGVRMPRNQLAKDFLKKCGTPVVAPSANLSGRPSPTTWQAVLEDLDGRIDCILQGEGTEIGLESTVVDCRTEIPLVLRLGAVSFEELRSVVRSTAVATAESKGEIRSPGLRHKHYAPKAQVVIYKFDETITGGRAAFIGYKTARVQFAYTKIVADVDEYARELYEFFRECDRRDIRIIYCESVDETGVGAALMDRIRRAAEA